MTAAAIRISDWKERESGTLRAFFAAEMPSGVVFHELSLHTRGGKWWVSFPARPIVIDGTVQREASGKTRYGPPLISFATRAARDRFTDQVLAALRASQPEFFVAERELAQ
jgi:hypothetical protein